MTRARILHQAARMILSRLAGAYFAQLSAGEIARRHSPGRKRKRGETLPDCPVRKLREELRVVVETGRPLVTVPYACSHSRITFHAVQCQLHFGAPREIDAADIRWIRYRELERFAMGNAARRLAERITMMRYKNGGGPLKDFF